MDKYKDMFFSECREHFQKLDLLLVDLEKGSVDEKVLRNLLGEAHSLKGMCSTMGYADVSQVFHELESYLVEVKEQGRRCKPEEGEVLFFGFDLAQKYIEKLEQGDRGCDLDVFFTKIEIFKKNQQKTNQKTPTEAASVLEINKSNNSDMPVLAIRFSLKKNTALPSARAYVILDEMQSYGEIVASAPTVDELKNGIESSSYNVTFATGLSHEEVNSKISRHSEIKHLSVKVATTKKIKDISGVQEAENKTEANKDNTELNAKEFNAIKKQTSVRIETSSLDKLLGSVEELIINESQLREKCKEFATRDISSDFTKVSKLILSIYSMVSDLRMFPFEHLSSRFPRAIRDIAKELSKKVNFVMTGQSIKLDRSMLDELAGPLLHIFRNAIDHGIEEEKVRISRGKEPEATIRVDVSREKETVSIVISDDGNGIDYQKVRQKGVALGMFSEKEGTEFSEKELMDVLTTPGFSTASEINMLSGRGVGLDVVKSKISGMGGSLFIRSISGKGTTISIELPMTVAVIKALLITSSEHIFAVPISRIYMSTEVKKKHVYRTKEQRMFDCGGDLVPLVILSEVLQIEKTSPEKAWNEKPSFTESHPDSGDYYSVIVVSVRGEKVGFAVDKIFGQHEIVVKALKQPLEKLSFFSGATVLGDGTSVLILDVFNLFYSKDSSLAMDLEG